MFPRQYWPARTPPLDPAQAILAVFQDNHDETVTVTVSGSVAGATNTVYTQVIGQGTGVPRWVAQGSRVGDGSFTFTPGRGIYWGHVKSSRGAGTSLSNLSQFNSTDGLDEVHERCLQATYARLLLLTFAGTSESPAGVQGVYRDGMSIDVSRPFPRIEVTIEGVAEEWLDRGVNVRDDSWLPVMVTIIDRNDPLSYHQRRRKYMRWRRQITDAFAFHRPDTVPESLKSGVKCGAMLPNPGAPVFSSKVLVRYLVRLPRGLYNY